jgi:gluconolactonase
LADAAQSELAAGVYAVKGREVTLLTDELEGPNGIALSPDERYLYVGNWDPERKIVLRIDLRTGKRTVLHDMTDGPGEDAIDGLAVDPEGRLYVCGPGGIWVLSPDGEHLETLRLPEAPHNLAWGDDDGRTLYVTAETSVYRVRREEAR